MPERVAERFDERRRLRNRKGLVFFRKLLVVAGEQERAVRGLNVLAVGHPADGGDIHLHDFGDVLEDHRAQVGFVPREEILALVIHNGVDGQHQGLLALTDGIDEPLGRIDLLLYKHHRILLRLLLFGRLCVALEHLAVLAAYAQLRSVALVELEKYLTENGFEIVLVGENRSEEALEEARRLLGYSDSSE